MKIYIRSAGNNPEQGYDWWRLSDQSLLRESPGFVEGFDLSWFDDDQLSLVLRDHGQGLNLLVTGLPTKNRVDFAGRVLRNDLAFSATDNSDEQRLRNLTAAFIMAPSSKDLPNNSLQLRRTALIEKWEIASTIDACIRPGSQKDESGFEVNNERLHDALEKAINSVGKVSNFGSLLIKLDKFQVAVDSIERRQDVIAWLTSQASLPVQLEGRKVLVLVASYPGLSGLLSENIEYQNELQSRCKEVCCQLTNVVNWKDWRIIEPIPLNPVWENFIEPTTNKIKKVFNIFRR